MIMLPDYDDVIRCHTFTGGEYYLGTSGTRGRVDVFYEDIQMTAGQIASEFGTENVSVSVKEALRNNPDRWFTVVHAIEPNDDYVKGSLGAFGFPFLSAYWEDGGESRTSSCASRASSAFRSSRRAGTFCSSDIYGYGPGDECIEDNKTLQLMKRDYLNAVKKLVDPPMLADAAYQNDIMDFAPGEIYFVSMNGTAGGKPVIPALDIRPDMNALLAGINDARQAIRESYFVDLFMMVSNAQDRDKTAREIAELHEEKLSVLGPVLERLSKEQHSPSIEACVHYCRAAGLLPEPPEDIEGEIAQDRVHLNLRAGAEDERACAARTVHILHGRPHGLRSVSHRRDKHGRGGAALR